MMYVLVAVSTIVFIMLTPIYIKHWQSLLKKDIPLEKPTSLPNRLAPKAAEGSTVGVVKRPQTQEQVEEIKNRNSELESEFDRILVNDNENT